MFSRILRTQASSSSPPAAPSTSTPAASETTATITLIRSVVIREEALQGCLQLILHAMGYLRVQHARTWRVVRIWSARGGVLHVQLLLQLPGQLLVCHLTSAACMCQASVVT